MVSKRDEFSFRLPQGKEVEVVLVELDDGRIVARTRDEVEQMERDEAQEERGRS